MHVLAFLIVDDAAKERSRAESAVVYRKPLAAARLRIAAAALKVDSHSQPVAPSERARADSDTPAGAINRGGGRDSGSLRRMPAAGLSSCSHCEKASSNSTPGRYQLLRFRAGALGRRDDQFLLTVPLSPAAPSPFLLTNLETSVPKNRARLHYIGNNIYFVAHCNRAIARCLDASTDQAIYSGKQPE